MKVEQNIRRLKHLLNLYKIEVQDFLEIISVELKNPITEEELFNTSIKVSVLKRIDKVFEKGLHYYLDPKAPETSKEASIFFRKSKFNSELNIGAKKIVNQFEDFKISLSAIAKLSDIELDRLVAVYTINDNPKEVAEEIRKLLYPDFRNDLRDFLKALIGKFAEYNILVFEFVETWNKKETANIDGFFLNPNVIVLKRQQRSFRREIFTLIHELGHFLLDKEEIERLDITSLAKRNLSAVEKWCNDFAFNFLAYDYSKTLDNLDRASSENDYHHELIKNISSKTHLSKLALFTRLLYHGKISQSNYNKVKSDFEKQYQKKLEQEQQQKELDKQEGRTQGGSVSKPIKSPLLVSTIQTAFYEGVLDEYEVCKRLNIKPDQLDKYI